VIVPDPNYRPNPLRAVYVLGRIDQQMADRLTPQILRLQHANREPITVYIDSRGGDVAAQELILRLLNASNQDSEPPCQLITVVTNRAASAAADLLSAGDYAIAYPESTLLYHGSRQPVLDPVTVEYGSALTESLKMSNHQSAMDLARRAEGRFMFRFVTSRAEFPAVRQRLSNSSLTDLESFLEFTSSQLSTRASKLFRRARDRHHRYDELVAKCLVKAFKGRKYLSKATPPPPAKVQAAVMQKIIDFEVQEHKKDASWTFFNGGIARLSEGFLLLQEYIVSTQSQQFKNLCERWGHFVLTRQETDELNAIASAAARRSARVEKVSPHFAPLWSFFVALCHTLQEGEENYLMALDAFWLGLIDEVLGQDLRTRRILMEARPDPEAQSPVAEPEQRSAGR